jgi:hypothetical protein
MKNEINANNESNEKKLSFTWWDTWGWLGLILGTLISIPLIQDNTTLGFSILIVNAILMIMVLNYNKYAFLIATILTFNPLLWVINGIYLKNRWNEPKLNVNKNNSKIDG